MGIARRGIGRGLGAVAVPLVLVTTGWATGPGQDRPGDSGPAGDTGDTGGTGPAGGGRSVVDCIVDPSAREMYGPTDINAQSGNQGLSVGLNDEGTVSVLRWPSPSYYDQVRYTTEDRDLPDLGVHPADGAFLGVRVTGEGIEPETTWLRDWSTEQRYAPGYSDEVVTEHRRDDLGLTVTVRDVVAHPDDVYGRSVGVERDPGSPVDEVDLLAYENLSLVVSKQALFPVQDWCYEDQNTDRARYDSGADALVHHKAGTDESTGEESTVAVATGFAGPSDGVQVGPDRRPDGSSGSSGSADSEPGSGSSGRGGSPAVPLADASDGDLSGSTDHDGQTAGVLARTIALGAGAEGDAEGDAGEATLFLAAGPDPEAATDLLAAARDTGYGELAAAKRAWLEEVLADAPLPATADEEVLAVARRALVTLVTNTDRDSRAIVASIATQSPYGEDWPRDGAFFDYALDLIGQHGWVDRHHDFYVEAQHTADSPDPVLESLGVPEGNWGMNYYADGVVGGPIPWEIDETGYTLWNLWQHHRVTGDTDRLRERYPAIRAAADFLAGCRDPASGLQCPAIEDDNPGERQTIVGASTVWLGLDAAVAAARELGEAADADRWEARRDELGGAIDAELWQGDRYGGGSAPLIWPVCFRPLDDPRMASHLEAQWDRLAETFAEPEAGRRDSGLYEAKGLIALAMAWRDDPERLAQVRSGIEWVAGRHATPDTHVMGEVWERRGGEIVTTVSQPHTWEQVLLYLAALEAWPPEAVAGTPAGCGGALEELRALNRPGGPGLPAAGDGAAPAGGTSSGTDGGWPAGPVVGAGAVLVVALAAGAALARARWRRRAAG